MSREFDQLVNLVTHGPQLQPLVLQFMSGFKTKLDDAIASKDPSEVTALSANLGVQIRKLDNAIQAFNQQIVTGIQGQNGGRDYREPPRQGQEQRTY